ncbi:MAG: LPS export ABC transporter permease LptF [Alphaproteobacteria bacterium]|nr:MAG: LPS export ABC transporter permease LptF [Alphaproteobacteria bacterium]
MNRLARYIFTQAAGPLFFFTLILGGIIWLTQSLQMLDLVVNRGQSAGVFVYLSLLMLPSLLSDVLPIALFSAIFYTLHHLQNDSELVVMWSAGYSKLHIAVPILALSGLAFVLNVFLNLYLMPSSYRAMKDKVYEIRSDLATQLIKEGTFTNPSKGLTVYIREATSAGELKGILVYDTVTNNHPTTYMAESGRLIRKDREPELIMQKGNIQTVFDENLAPAYTSFDKYSLDLSAFISERTEVRREYRERYLSELFTPDLTKPWDATNANRLRAEGHNRLASPFYNVAFALIAVVAIAGGTFSRRGTGRRLLPAGIAVLVVRIFGFAAQNATSSATILAVLQYALPIGTILVCLFLLSDWRAYAEKWNIPVPGRKPILPYPPETEEPA